MGSLVRMGMIAGLGGLLYSLTRKMRRPKGNEDAAPVFSSGVTRNAGPTEQKYTDKRNWDDVDERSDESFPASDPPATY